jgi:hypothetical protein
LEVLLHPAGSVFGHHYHLPDPRGVGCRKAIACSAISNAIGFARFYSRSHDAVIRVYDEAGNVIETHEHAGEFKEA